MRIESVSPVQDLLSSRQDTTPSPAQAGNQTANQQPVEAPRDNTVSVLADDGKTVVYRTLDAAGQVIQQLPSEQVLALRQDAAKLRSNVE